MRKFYVLSLLVVMMLPVAAKAENMSHSSHGSMATMMPEKSMEHSCCKKMAGQTMSPMMKGMQCMGKNHDHAAGAEKPKCGCCAKMTHKKGVFTPRSSQTYEFNN